MLDCSIDAQYLRVRLGIEETWKPITGVAPNTEALMRILFVKLNPQRRVKWSQPQPRKVVAQVLNSRLVTDWRMRIRGACVRVGRILAALAMDVIEMLSLSVIGFEIVI
jgi:hypothetical protein